MKFCEFCEKQTPATLWSLASAKIFGFADMAQAGEGVVFACEDHREVLREVSDPAVEIFSVSTTTQELEEAIVL